MRITPLTLTALTVLASALTQLHGADDKLAPSFPNYAAVLPASDFPRANPIGAVSPELPFSWTQYAVVRQGATHLRFVGGYDPGLQPVQIEFLPVAPQAYNVLGTDPLRGILNFQTLPGSAGTTERVPFQVRARDTISTETFNLVIDIRDVNSRLRGTPVLTRSVGEVIRPGQIVRYSWTQAALGEKRPKVEAEFVGKTGAATGLLSSHITEVLALKAQPFVLGHYLMTVTPRDVRGEPPRGGTSNGQVFLCAFGSENLPPVTDGMSADTFLPAVGQSILLQPVAVDPETGASSFANQTYDFGDATLSSGVTGATSHTYGTPGIYRVRCTVLDDQGLAATAEDNVIVGAQLLPKLTFKFFKSIPPEEAGIGVLETDTLNTTFKDVNAQAGDRIVLAFNRNRFGRMSASDGTETDIVLGPAGGFSQEIKGAKRFIVTRSGAHLNISVSGASFDRTGDPRFGRAELKGIFKQQRIALCIVPADGSLPRVYAYTGNMQIKVIGGNMGNIRFVPEESIKGTATLKEPDPKKQEPY